MTDSNQKAPQLEYEEPIDPFKEFVKKYYPHSAANQDSPVLAKLVAERAKQIRFQETVRPEVNHLIKQHEERRRDPIARLTWEKATSIIPEQTALDRTPSKNRETTVAERALGFDKF